MKEKASFTVEGYAATQGTVGLSEIQNTGVILVPMEWVGKNVVCILTEESRE